MLSAVWCLVGDNYLGNLLFERTDALFWHFDPIKRGQMGPSTVQFIRGSNALTMSVTESMAIVDVSNNDARLTVDAAGGGLENAIVEERLADKGRRDSCQRLDGF